MTDIILGILAVLAGLFLCFQGHWAMRVLLAVWGAFVGFAVGAGAVDRIGGDGFLTTATGWIVGFVVAMLFSALAYLYYAVGIVLSMAAMGFVLGGTLASALGASQDWLIVSVGVVVGALLALLAVVGDLPMVLLIVLSALTGASVTIGGLMLIFGVSNTAEITTGDTTAADHPIWYLTFVVLAVVGMVYQFSQISAWRATVRESWGTKATSA